MKHTIWTIVNTIIFMMNLLVTLMSVILYYVYKPAPERKYYTKSGRYTDYRPRYTYTREEVAQARSEGYSEGFDDGMNALKEEEEER